MKDRDQKREERLRKSMERDINPRWTSRGGRRLLVGMGAGCLALMWAASVVCAYLAPSDAAMYTTFALFGVALVAGMFVAGMLFTVTRGTTRLPEHMLDERQVVERLRAHADAHRATLVLLSAAAAVVLLTLPDEGDVATVPSAVFAVFSFALLATVFALPLLIAAWRMPDPLPDDEDADL